MQAREAFNIRVAGLGKHGAAVVGQEAIGHDAVEPGHRAHLPDNGFA